MIEFGDFRYDPDSRLLQGREGDVPLQPRAQGVLEELLARPGEVVSKEDILATVWEGAFVGEDSLTRAVSQLRQALGDDPRNPTYIQTIARRGYRLIAEVATNQIRRSVARGAGGVREGGGDEGERGSTSLGGREVSDGRRVVPWAVAAVTFVAAVMSLAVLALSWAPRAGEPPTVAHSVIPLERPPEQRDRSVAPNSPLVISPDGSLVVYRFDAGPLLMRNLTRDTVTRVAGAENGFRPFFSSDGEWLAYFARNDDAEWELRKVRLGADGGEPVTLCSPPAGVANEEEGPDIGWGGGSWGDHGRIVFAGGRSAAGRPTTRGLQEVTATGGDCTDLTALDLARGDTSHRWPQVLPGGAGVLFSRWGTGAYDGGEIVVHSLDSGATEVVAWGTYARYVPTYGPTEGHIVVARDDTLHAIPFDAQQLRTRGEEIPVLGGVYTATDGWSGSAHFSVSRGGRLVFREVVPRMDRRVLLVDREGHETPLPGLAPRPYESARYSPDGGTLALVTGEGEVYRYDLQAGREERLLGPFIDSEGVRHKPRLAAEWTPDGLRLLIHAKSGLTTTPVFEIRADPPPEPRNVPTIGGNQVFPVGLLDHPSRVLTYSTGSTGLGVREAPLDGSGPDSPFMDEVLQIDLSADARLLAYRVVAPREAATRSHVYVRPYDDSGLGKLVSTDGGGAPAWVGPEANMLAFRSRGYFWLAEIASNSRVDVGVPQRAFADVYYRGGAWRPRTYDVSPDGAAFALIRDLEQAPLTERFRVIENWFEVLKRDVPMQR